MTAEEKKWIDEAAVIDLLRKWRFEPLGSNYFTADIERAEYFKKVMTEKRNADPSGWTRASKALGW